MWVWSRRGEEGSSRDAATTGSSVRSLGSNGSRGRERERTYRFVVIVSDFTATRGAIVIDTVLAGAGDGVARLGTNVTSATSSTRTLFGCISSRQFLLSYRASDVEWEWGWSGE